MATWLGAPSAIDGELGLRLRPGRRLKRRAALPCRLVYGTTAVVEATRRFEQDDLAVAGEPVGPIAGSCVEVADDVRAEHAGWRPVPALPKAAVGERHALLGSTGWEALSWCCSYGASVSLGVGAGEVIDGRLCRFSCWSCRRPNAAWPVNERGLVEAMHPSRRRAPGQAEAGGSGQERTRAACSPAVPG